jgi:DNA (cytosine-5)-methyltransferase 1
VHAIDLFAGARATGVTVQWAANYWPLAVEYHALNRPETSHACQDLHQADWSVDAVRQHPAV